MEEIRKLQDWGGDWITVAELAKWLHVGKSSIYRWIEEKKLVALKVDNLHRIQERSVVDFLMEHSTV